MHCVRHDLQRPATAGAFSSFVLLQLDPSFLNNRLRKFNTRAHQACVNEEERGRKRLHAPQPPRKWSLAIQMGTVTLLPDDRALNSTKLLAPFGRSTSSP